MFGIELAGGSLIFAVFLVIAFLGVAHSYFTRRGSAINQHPYGKMYGGAPGAREPGSITGRDPQLSNDWMRARGVR